MSNNNNIPTWFTDQVGVPRQSGAAWCFHVVGNNSDHVMSGAVFAGRLGSWLMSFFAGSAIKPGSGPVSRLVLTYDREAGIGFPIPAQGEIFDRLTGLAAQQAAPSPFAALGVSAAPKPGQRPKSPAAALPLITAAVEAIANGAANSDGIGSAVVIMFYGETISPPADIAMMPEDARTTLVTLQKWATSPAFMEVGTVLMLSNSIENVHSALRGEQSGWALAEVPMPSRGEKEEFIRFFLNQAPALRLQRPVTMPSPEKLAELMASLTLVGTEAVLRTALQTAAGGALEENVILRATADVIRRAMGDSVEFMDSSLSFADYGASPEFWEVMQERVIQPLEDGDNDSAPMGLLLVGGPGLGKTFFVQCLAGSLGRRVISVQLGKLRSKYYSESAQRVSALFAAVENAGPVVVFMDEIDSQGVRRGGANAASNSDDEAIFQQFLSFTGDARHRGRILFVYATNRPDNIDAAYMRPGRVDLIVPFFPPDATVRRSVLTLRLQKAGIEVEPPEEVIAATAGFTHAELDSLAVATRARLRRQPDPVAALREASLTQRQSTKGLAFMSALAAEYCSIATLLPPEWRAVKDAPDAEKQFQAITGLGAAGQNLF